MNKDRFDCNKYSQKDFWAYLMDRLSVEEMIKVQYHLSVCKHCQRQVLNMRKLYSLMQVVEKNKNQKILFFKGVNLAWVAVFFILFSLGISYYLIHLEDDQYSIEIKEVPTYEVMDSLKKKTDSTNVISDSVSYKKINVTE